MKLEDRESLMSGDTSQRRGSTHGKAEEENGLDQMDEEDQEEDKENQDPNQQVENVE